MNEADYIVVRASPDLPAGFLPPHLDGHWYDLESVPRSWREPGTPIDGVTVSEAVCVPTGRFEVRGDGAVAEVWEMRP